MPATTRGSKTVVLAILVPLLWLIWLRVFTVTPGTEVDNDSYYHIMMADLFPEVCLEKTFPYTSLSVWKDHFYDKELLFHGVLSGMRRLTQAVGLSLEPPFHVPVLAGNFLLLAAFVLVARSWNLPKLWLWPMLLAAISPFFTYRILMLRPHNLAILLMLLYALHLQGVRTPRDLWKPFAFGILFAYAYSSPHIVLFPAAIYGAALCLKGNRRLAWMLPLATLAGLVAGFTLHPQFPNTFLLWKIQAIDVVRQAVSPNLSVYVGDELSGPDAKWILVNAGVFLLFGLNVFLFRRLIRRKKPAQWPAETLLCVGLQVWFMLNVLWIKRAMEYACPFSILATGLLLRDLLSAGALRRSVIELHGRAAAAAVAVLLAGTAAASAYQVKKLTASRFHEFGTFTNWAAATLPDGMMIANLHWSDFPQLFYGAPQFRYLMGLDPMFGYHADPERVEKLEKFRTGQLVLQPSELMELTGAQFAFTSYNGWELARDLKQMGYVVVYEGPDGWLFDLAAGDPGSNSP